MSNRLPIPGGDDGDWGSILNSFLQIAHNADGTIQSAALSAAGAELTANKNQSNGYVGLDGSGLIDTSNLASGTANSTTYLRGDGTWTAPNSGSSSLASDSDVTITTPQNNQVLSYDSSSSKWQNVNLAESDITNLSTDLATKATDTNVVHLAGSETVTGAKDFTGGATINGTNIVVGSDSRLTDQRTPTDGSVTTAKITSGGIAESAVTNLTTDLAASEKTSNKGAASGYAGLNSLGQLPTANLPPENMGVFFNRTANGSSNSEIFYMMNDGSNIRQVTSNATYQSWWPKVSPDGSRLLFLRAPSSLSNYDSDFTQQSLWTCNIDGSNIVQILAEGWQGASSWIGTPNWQPNGRDIIFVGGSGALLIYQIHSDGGTPVNIPITGVSNGATDVSVSPDGTQILFCYNKDVYLAPITGGNATQITTDGNVTQNYDPYFSFDGQTIVMLTNFGGVDIDHFGGQWGLRTITSSGTNLTTVLNDGNINSKAAWSEDGYLYFHRFYYGSPAGTGGDSNFSLAKIRADGSGSVIRLTNGTVRDYMPDTHISRYPRVPNHHANSHLLGGVDPLLWTLVHGGGTLANRPAPTSTNNGYFYYALDVNGGTQYESNGSSWVQISPGLTQAPQAHEATHLAGGSDSLAWSTIHNGGSFASRPSPASTNAGYTYFATDTGILYQSNGSSWVQLAPGLLGTPQIVSRSGAATSVVNSTAETTLFSEAITGGAANQIYRFRANGDWLNNTGSAVNYQYRMYLGASNLLLDTSTLSIPTNANRGEWNLEGFLYITTTTSERLAVTLVIPGASTVGWQLSPLTATGGANASVDMTTNPSLIFSVQLGTAASTADCFLRAFYIEGIG